MLTSYWQNDAPDLSVRRPRAIVAIVATIALALFSTPLQPVIAQDLQSCLEKLIQTEPYRTNFARLEQGLLDAGRLPSSDGAGYLQLARETIEQGDLNYLLPPELELELIQSDFECPTPITEPPSGLVRQLAATIDTVENARDLSPKLLIQSFLDHFPPADWEQPLTKHLFFTYIATYATADRGILDRLPPWSDAEPAIEALDPRNVFTVLVDAENRLYVRGEEMPIDQLRAAAKRFIINPDNDATLAESPSQAVIALKNDLETNYQAYLSVYNELRDAYRELWDERCRQKYGYPYSNDLPLDIRQQIRAEIPFAILEAGSTQN
jgi:biopolymer transport protein ExbD